MGSEKTENYCVVSFNEKYMIVTDKTGIFVWISVPMESKEDYESNDELKTNIANLLESSELDAYGLADAVDIVKLLEQEEADFHDEESHSEDKSDEDADEIPEDDDSSATEDPLIDAAEEAHSVEASEEAHSVEASEEAHPVEASEEAHSVEASEEAMTTEEPIDEAE